MRAVSTVLDASLCLLLVTASALTLAGTPLDSESSPELDPDPEPDTADEIAEVLTTTTARVTYAVGGRNRTAHDTLAGLLAAAALADAEGASTAVSQSASTNTFQRAVTAKVSRALRHSDVGVQVVADSNPGRDSALGSRVVAGGSPPPNADVHAAEVEVRRVRLTVRTWSR